MEDRLSELPESLIHHILSFLSMRDVVSTTLLAKRWKNLWTTLPCLNFTGYVEDEQDIHQIRKFVNGALIFWKGTKLLKLTIEIEDHFDISLLVGDMDLWVCFAVQNRVEELNLHLHYDEDEMGWDEDEDTLKDIYTAPQCLYSCSSIRKLSLVGCHLRIPASPAWNQLKSLKLGGYHFTESVINRILSVTPQLEVFELRVMEKNVNMNIQSTSLKKLKIVKYLYAQPSPDTVLSICCPNLETLHCSGVFFSKCLFTNVSSLTDVTLELYSTYYDAQEIKFLGETMRRVFSTFQHVKRLTLSRISFQALQVSKKENLFSPLPNVVFLKLEDFSSQLTKMVHVHEIFPNLKTLAFTDPTFGPSSSEFETGLSESVLLQLKIIEITSNFDSSSVFRLIEVFLKHCSVLEKMVVRVNCFRSYTPEQLLEITDRLLNMSRSSPTANVIFNKK